MLHPYQFDKVEEKDESFIGNSNSRVSTNFSSFRVSIPASPSIKVLGFRNFVPSFDFAKLMEEEPKLIKDPKEIKDLKLDYSPIVLHISKPDDCIQPTIVEIYESGPFLIFTYGESLRNGHPKDLLTLENIQIDYSSEENFLTEDLFFKEDGKQFMMKIKETDCIYIVPKDLFAQKMNLYSISEETWQETSLQTLKTKVETINSLIKGKPSFQEEDLVPLEPIHKGAFGECYRSYCRHTRDYYGIKCVYIKSPEFLTMVFQELDILTKILKSQNANLASILSLKLIERDYEPLCLRIVFDLGLGTLEEFAAFRSNIQDSWEEDELIRVTTELLKQHKNLNELNISVRDIRPSNIILSKDFKSFKFADFGLAHQYENDDTSGEIVGTPKYMAHEALKSIDQCTLVRHETTLAELYSIGRTIIALTNTDNENMDISHTNVLAESSKEVLRDRYSTLWDKYLCKLLDTEPMRRKEALRGFRPPKGEILFIEKKSKPFQNYLAQKEFREKKDAMLDFDALLPYFWQLGNIGLIGDMEKTLVEKFRLQEVPISKVRRFFEKLAALYEAEKNYTKAIEIYEQLAGLLEEEKNRKELEDEDHREDYNPLILDLHSKIGGLYRLLGDFNKSLENYEKALYFEYLKDSEELVHDFKNHIEIGGVYEELEHSDLAIDTYTKVQERFRQSFKKNTNQLQEAILAEKMGRCFFKRGELLAAIEEITRAISCYEVCYGKHHVAVGVCEKLLGDIYKKAGDHEEAIRQYEIYFHNHLHGQAKYDLVAASLIEELGDFHQDRRNYDRAVENYKKAIHIYHYNDDSASLCRVYEKIAECYTLQKRYIVAVKTLRECYQIKAADLGENSLELIHIIEKIANNFVQDGEHKEALKEYTNALSIAMFHKSKEDPLIKEILKNIGKISPLAFLAYKNYKNSSPTHSYSPSRQSYSPSRQQSFALSRHSFSSKSETPKHNNAPMLISLNTIEDVRGVLGGLDFDTSLSNLRDLIVEECKYLKFFKYNFVRQGKAVDSEEEKTVSLEECVITKDGFNYLLIEEGKQTARERATF